MSIPIRVLTSQLTSYEVYPFSRLIMESLLVFLTSRRCSPTKKGLLATTAICRLNYAAKSDFSTKSESKLKRCEVLIFEGLGAATLKGTPRKFRLALKYVHTFFFLLPSDVLNELLGIISLVCSHLSKPLLCFYLPRFDDGKDH